MHRYSTSIGTTLPLRSYRNYLALAALTMAFLPFLLNAQSPSDPAKAALLLDEEAVIELSPFVIQTSSDRGYLSTNAVSGTALNIAIRDLPMPLDVLNSEFLEDIQANDFKEALRYSAGVFTETFSQGVGTGSANANESRFSDISPSASANVNDPFVNTVSIRGYAVPNQQRMGFRVGATVPAYGVVLGGLTDSANVDRIEIVRGPQALLYGVNVLSGVANLMPKMPTGRFANSADFQIGSHGLYRGALDHQGVIIKKMLHYRVVGSYEERDSAVEFQHDKRQYGAAQLEWLPLPQVRLFGEAQAGSYERNGFGPTNSLYDVSSGSNNSQFLRNKYNEQYNWSRTWAADYHAAELTDANYALLPAPNRPAGFYNFKDLGRYARISGPDSYYNRDEYNFLGQLYWTIVENLNLEAGVYYTHLDSTRFAPNMRTLTNRESTVVIAFDKPGQTSLGPTRWQFQPESALDIVERFRVPNATNPTAPDFEEYKVVRYWWEKTHTESETLQNRVRLAYTLETNLMENWGGEKHTFLAGFQRLEDKVRFTRRSDDVSQYNTNTDFQIFNPPPVFVPGTGLVRPPAEIRIIGAGREATDPLRFRSIFDFSPLRYEGEELAIPGVFRRSQMGDFKYRYLARSGTIDATILNEGYNFIYQGQYWKDRLTLIGGLRLDRYRQEEREQLIALDPDRLTNRYQGSTYRVLPLLVGDGTSPYQPDPSLPQSLNQKIAEELEIFRQQNPRGAYSSLPDSGLEESLTRTAGLSWRVLNELSVYASYGEGIFPNTGQRDGNNDLIAAEETANQEIGLKFDLWKSRISGRFSYFVMNRYNAVTFLDFAPSPKYWHGHPSGLSADQSSGGVFDPVAAAGGVGVKGSNLPVTYTVWAEPILQAFREAGRPNVTAEEIAKEYGILYDAVSFPGLATTQTYLRPAFVVPYSLVQNNPNDPLRKGMDAIMRDRSNPFLPIRYFGEPNLFNNNPSNYTSGSNVLFDEEATGYEFSLIFTPIDQLEFILSYAHIERQVVGKGFRFVDAVDADGKRWSTPYDRWVYFLGPDAFDDPSDPTSTNGKGVNGLNLANVPEDSAAFWGMYSFDQGKLKGFSIGMGVQWYGPAPTSTPVGGNNFTANRYPTPETPDRFITDLSFIYRTEFWGIAWRMNLRIDNLFNKTYDQVVVAYDDLENPGQQVFRRTEIYYPERSYRFSITAEF